MRASAWTGSWTGEPDNPSVVSAVSAMIEPHPLHLRLRCGNLACTGKPFTEHRNIPDLRRVTRSSRSPTKGLCTSATGGRRRSQANRPLTSLVHASPTRTAAGYRPGHLCADHELSSEIKAELAAVGVGLRDDAYLFSNDPALPAVEPGWVRPGHWFLTGVSAETPQGQASLRVYVDQAPSLLHSSAVAVALDAGGADKYVHFAGHSRPLASPWPAPSRSRVVVD
jgi:hypothetical protein